MHFVWILQNCLYSILDRGDLIKDYLQVLNSVLLPVQWKRAAKYQQINCSIVTYNRNVLQAPWNYCPADLRYLKYVLIY